MDDAHWLVAAFHAQPLVAAQLLCSSVLQAVVLAAAAHTLFVLSQPQPVTMVQPTSAKLAQLNALGVVAAVEEVPVQMLFASFHVQPLVSAQADCTMGLQVAEALATLHTLTEESHAQPLAAVHVVWAWLAQTSEEVPPVVVAMGVELEAPAHPEVLQLQLTLAWQLEASL